MKGSPVRVRASALTRNPLKTVFFRGSQSVRVPDLLPAAVLVATSMSASQGRRLRRATGRCLRSAPMTPPADRRQPPAIFAGEEPTRQVRFPTAWRHRPAEECRAPGGSDNRVEHRYRNRRRSGGDGTVEGPPRAGRAGRIRSAGQPRVDDIVTVPTGLPRRQCRPRLQRDTSACGRRPGWPSG